MPRKSCWTRSIGVDAISGIVSEICETGKLPTDMLKSNFIALLKNLGTPITKIQPDATSSQSYFLKFHKPKRTYYPNYFIFLVCVQDQAYHQKARETLEITWNLLNLKDGWKLEKDEVSFIKRKCNNSFKIL